ncbi:uncharacterized protein BJ171DRAFT_500945 [Polychytrium aggregatum]|uniref:uncharacterized protein n=1 Tax=Polychytrium aggregatum TaxID=110093 RepID=UPI0022FE9B32|nr:uncharacterized protein BJ171DRAFT_500945 [Polychytrium aggregatum]KAI9205613.1 hypothetical protein BJ171DRAFT_500945 [Polychytrium aggregatum]
MDSAIATVPSDQQAVDMDKDVISSQVIDILMDEDSIRSSVPSLPVLSIAPSDLVDLMRSDFFNLLLVDVAGEQTERAIPGAQLFTQFEVFRYRFVSIRKRQFRQYLEYWSDQTLADVEIEPKQQNLAEIQSMPLRSLALVDSSSESIAEADMSIDGDLELVGLYRSYLKELFSDFDSKSATELDFEYGIFGKGDPRFASLDGGRPVDIMETVATAGIPDEGEDLSSMMIDDLYPPTPGPLGPQKDMARLQSDLGLDRMVDTHFKRRNQCSHVVVYDDTGARYGFAHFVAQAIKDTCDPGVKLGVLEGGLDHFNACFPMLLTTSKRPKAINNSFIDISHPVDKLRLLQAHLVDSVWYGKTNPGDEPIPILPQVLYLGSCFTATQPLVSQYNIKQIIRLGWGFVNHCVDSDSGSPTVVYHDFPIDDSPDEPIINLFERTADLIEAARLKGEAVLVHCHAGVSRSSTIVLAYLIKFCSMSLYDAWELTYRVSW